MRIALTLLAALAAAIPPAHAHQASDALITLNAEGTRLQQRLDVPLRDLDRELWLDADDDGDLTWAEVRTRWPDIEALAVQGLRLQPEGRTCEPLAPGAPALVNHGGGVHAVLTRAWQCDGPVQAVTVDYRLFERSDPTHRGVLQWQGADDAQTHVLVPGAAPLRVGPSPDAPAGGSTLARFAGFVGQGVHHILIGLDHVLFLLALLLPAVLRRGGGAAPGGAPAPMQRIQTARAPGFLAWALPWPAASVASARPAAAPAWTAAPAFGAVAWDVARVVTAFTVAHSITLTLAMLGWVNPSSRIVESVIAASVVLAALNNLWPVAGAGRWKLTFAFGLVHGFGFAGALSDLGLHHTGLAAPLAGFNLGVELGQLGIVALFLPLAWALRRTVFYRRVLLQGGSAVIALLALVWLVERAADVTLWPAA